MLGFGGILGLNPGDLRRVLFCGEGAYGGDGGGVGDGDLSTGGLGGVLVGFRGNLLGLGGLVNTSHMA